MGGEKPDFKEFSGPDLSVLDLERPPNDFPREVDLTAEIEERALSFIFDTNVARTDAHLLNPFGSSA